MNSRSSRPRSPTRASTTTSQSASAASIASRVDLPTPEAAKRPSRWPRRQVAKASSTRTPRSSRGPSRARCPAGGGAARSGRGNGARPQRAEPIQRPAQRVQHPAEPDSLDRQGRGRGKPGRWYRRRSLPAGRRRARWQGRRAAPRPPPHRSRRRPEQVQPAAEPQPGRETLDGKCDTAGRYNLSVQAQLRNPAHRSRRGRGSAQLPDFLWVD